VPDLNLTKAERSIDRLISSRAREREATEAEAAAWAESAKRYQANAEAARREAWVSYHRDLEQLHLQLAAEHGAAARRLVNQTQGRQICLPGEGP
jgi:hypothetical protein